MLANRQMITSGSWSRRLGEAVRRSRSAKATPICISLVVFSLRASGKVASTMPNARAF